jgi:predicted DNA-binding protein with PD1-like motif
MEGKEDVFGVTKGQEIPANHHAPAGSTAPTPNRFTGSETPAASATPTAGNENNIPAGESALALVTVTPVIFPGTSTDGKKKRGRPRKYGPDGKPLLPLSPMPISASIPLAGEFTGWKNGGGRPVDSFKKKKKKQKLMEFESSGVQLGFSVGANFTPHVITVNPGEDVSMKIISFSQLGSRAICILAANGSVSNVTLRQPNSSGGTLTYEGKFEILSLSGSFTPINDNHIGVTKSRSGGMSVSLAGPDGRVLGGGLAGLLVAGSPVQVVIASFLSNHQDQVEQPKPKKQRVEYAQTACPTVYPIVSPPRATEPVTAFNINSLPNPNTASAHIMSPENNNLSFSGSDSKELSSSKFEVSC